MISLLFISLIPQILSLNNCQYQVSINGASKLLDLSPLQGSIIIITEQSPNNAFFGELTPCSNNVTCSCYNSPTIAAQCNNGANPPNCNGVLGLFDNTIQPKVETTSDNSEKFSFTYNIIPSNVCPTGCGGRQLEINYICDRSSTGKYNPNLSKFYETDRVNDVCEYHFDIYTQYACTGTLTPTLPTKKPTSMPTPNVTEFLPYGADSKGNALHSTIQSKSYCTQGSSTSPCTEQFRCPWLNAGSNLYYQAALWDKKIGITNGVTYIDNNMVAYYSLGTTGGNFPINQNDKNQVGSCWHVKGVKNSNGFGQFNQNDIILQDEGLGGSDSNADICSIQGGCGDYNCCKVSIPDVTYKAQCPAGTGPGYAGCGPSQQNEIINTQYGNFTITKPGGCPHTFDGINLNTLNWEQICTKIYKTDVQDNDSGPLYQSCINEGPFMSTGADPVVAKRVRCPEGLIRLTGLKRSDNNNFPNALIGMSSTNTSYWEGGSKTVSNGGDCRIDTANYGGDGVEQYMIFCGPPLNQQPGPVNLDTVVWGGNSQQVAFAKNVSSNPFLRSWVQAYGSVPIFYSSNVNGGDWTNEVDNDRLCY